MRLALILLTIASSAVAQERLTLDDAIARGLEKNGDLVIERESLTIANAAVARAEAAYEPIVRADVRYRDRTDPVNSILSGAPAGEVAPRVQSVQSSASVVRLLPTGATVSLVSGINRDRSDSVLALLTPSWSTLLGAEIRQPLMQNRRIDPARRAIRIARADRSRAESSLRRTATEIVASIERAYWTITSARREVAIRESNVKVATQQRADTKTRIEAGVQAESDLAQTDAEVERRRGDLLSARENLLRAENALRNLIARDADDPIWTAALATEEPAAADTNQPLDTSAAIAQALAQRPELEELQQRLARQDVEIAAALDRVRPQLDLVASYNGRGLAGAENDDAISPFGRPVVVPDALDGSLGRSLGALGENRFPDATVGVSLAIPIGNTAAKQDVAIARAIRRQNEATLAQARQRVAYEVRNAAAALDSARQRIEAAEASRRAAEIQLQAERDRFQAGTTNNFFVLTRQNDLAAAQLAEVVARSDYQKAETEFARATGTLLTARGIEVRGSR